MTLLVKVLGIVQGVGYRPFVARLAKELGITGTVRNSGGIVHILAQGDAASLDLFVWALSERCPPGADVRDVLTETVPDEQDYADFQIIESLPASSYTPVLPADLPVCAACRAELADPANRRFGYSFISCVDCGPRYSILEAIPYDRAAITMHEFPMCPACNKEYKGDDRRRHAQTISCHDCGPQLILALPDPDMNRESGAGAPFFAPSLFKDDALSRSIEIINSGGILAVKGIGGYQLACRPDIPAAVDRLRTLKLRDRKPFAVMFPNSDAVKELCTVSREEEALLHSTAHPIVLLTPHTIPFCLEVSGDSRFLGSFLPYTALHQQLTDACGPLIMTSANLSDEPIMYRDEDILRLNSPLLDGVLYNTRRIVTPLDDSVARVAAGKTQIIRRSRGYVPLPITLSSKTTHTILAAGGDLKSSFCLYGDDRAYLSQYFGDMISYGVQQNYRENLKRMQELFRMEPDIIACDLHPLYRTTELADKLAASKNSDVMHGFEGLSDGHEDVTPKRISVQHHHAHAASVMAEHGLDSCIGVAYDGTGYGTDGAVWGGEFLLCRGASFTREAHLGYVSLCGGDEAARQADMTASCYLAAAGDEIRHKDAGLIRAALAVESLTYRTSSMGRLFDAVSFVLGICSENSYEGECAVRLENAAAEALRDGISPFPLHFPVVHGKDKSVADPVAVLHDIHCAAQTGSDRKALALGFHMAVIEMTVSVCLHIKEKTGESKVALSGGVFANLLLVENCTAELDINGFTVYTNESVPSNDGGICLGQAWICGQMLK